MQAELFEPGTDVPIVGPEGRWVPPPSFRRLALVMNHIAPKDAAAAIAPLLSKPIGTTSDEPATRTLVISDLHAHAMAAAHAARVLDAPSQEVRIAEYLCTYVEPAQLMALGQQVISRRDGAMSQPPASTGSKAVGELILSPGGRGILVVSTKDRIDLWMDVLATLDQREPVQATRYPTAPATAAEVARVLEQTLTANRAIQPTASIADPRWSALPDDATGTLLITGTPAQHEMVEQLLASLAAAPPESRRPLKTFVLRHRSVREVIGVIERLISAGALDSAAAAAAAAPTNDGADGADGSAGDQSGAAAAWDGQAGKAEAARREASRVVAPPRELPPLLSGMGEGGGRDGPNRGSSSRGGRGRSGLTLTADEATNTLIAIGEPHALARLEALIPTLDVRQAQVMIEAVLVSLSDSQTLQLGIELEKIEVSGDTVFRLASLFGLSTAGAGGAGGGGRIVGDAAGFTGVVLNPGEFSIILRALETINNGRAISVPKVLVNNNQQASFNSSLQQPYASTNASSTVATTSFGGTFDAGTVITVRPQIAEGDHLVLDYQVRLSSFTGSATANLPPPRQENSVTSIATIPDGYTVVVGGLEAITDGEGESRVPGIGAIPIIGELFKNRTSQRSRARFFVFLRANVMRGTTGSGTGFEELKYLSDRAAEDSGIAGEFDGWPVMRPRVIR
ncbi:MAG: hypothetical protein KF869_15610 [Phycisphaeraceae bacterium]|nr:hypothetical protein [Phycisphaeraceae bacterium]